MKLILYKTKYFFEAFCDSLFGYKAIKYKHPIMAPTFRLNIIKFENMIVSFSPNYASSYAGVIVLQHGVACYTTVCGVLRNDIDRSLCLCGSGDCSSERVVGMFYVQ